MNTKLQEKWENYFGGEVAKKEWFLSKVLDYEIALWRNYIKFNL